MLKEMALSNEKKDESEQLFLSFLIKQKSFDVLKTELTVLEASYYEDIGAFGRAIGVIKTLPKNDKFTDHHKYYLAVLYDKAGDLDFAIETVREILSENPNHVDALNFLGYSLLEKNINYDEAYRYLVKAAELRPQDGYILDSLGWYYYKIGNYKQAVIELKKAHAIVSEDPTINKHLAIVYRDLERYVESQKYYREALKYSTIEGDKDFILKELKILQEKRTPASSK